MSLTVPDAVDYKGNPADRSKTGGWVPAALVLGLFICLSLIVLIIFYEKGSALYLPKFHSQNYMFMMI